MYDDLLGQDWYTKDWSSKWQAEYKRRGNNEIDDDAESTFSLTEESAKDRVIETTQLTAEETKFSLDGKPVAERMTQSNDTISNDECLPKWVLGSEVPESGVEFTQRSLKDLTKFHSIETHEEELKNEKCLYCFNYLNNTDEAKQAAAFRSFKILKLYLNCYKTTRNIGSKNENIKMNN